MIVKKNIIDYRKALEMTGGDEEFLFDLIRIYIADFKIRFEVMNHAVADRNFDQLYHQGHTLKGSSATLNLTSLQEYAFQIELAGKGKNQDMARKALAELNRAFWLFLQYHNRLVKLRAPGVA